MKQLTLKAIMEVISQLKNDGYSAKEIAEMPIYIGRDDELNGIHTAWYANIIKDDNEDDQYFIEMINEDCCNIKFSGKAILIS